MRCCGEPGVGTFLFAGIRLADWALALTSILMLVLLAVGVVALIRVLLYGIMLVRRSVERRR